MNKLKLCAIGLVLAGGLSAQTSVQCQGLTKDTLQCKNKTLDSCNQGFPVCYLHNPNYIKKVDNTVSVSCSGITKKGKSCKNRTKHKSGYCHHHRN